MSAVLEGFRDAHDGALDSFYWVLRLKQAELEDGLDIALRMVPPTLKVQVLQAHRAINAYFDNVRYAMLDPVTQVWGTLVNSMRVAAAVESATPRQRATFVFPAESIVKFFVAARDTPEVADALYHAFKPMPAPECQALAALFNVHVGAKLDAESLVKIVRLIDAEGPLADDDHEAIAVLTNTGLIHAAFRGLRGGG